MSNIHHPPAQKALEQLRQLSQDEENWWRALARERALHDEASLLNSERQKGREEGRAALLVRQLMLKFGAIPAPLQQRLHEANESELDTWAERFVFAERLDDVFR